MGSVSSIASSASTKERPLKRRGSSEQNVGCLGIGFIMSGI
jgi:hypothetical protein